MKIETKHNIGNPVWIKELSLSGRIMSIWVGDTGFQYHVRWMTNSSTTTAYLFEDEIGDCPAAKSPGFNA